MKRRKWAMQTAAGTALAALIASAVAQTAASAPPDSHAPMAKQPEAASSAGGSSNPDNMPIKRPAKPTNDRMSHEPPASGANAK
ncbi:hypothetical protein BJG93_06230 [Paraburkholderia sprentiae WSM5005]|uniref:Uncharacterized protein n=1 Tax=Paraburkholderia sprentiae WSM5005 TaxID=754502 RepID=A0A1I9YFD5_9BURK|nr:hypothetical protein [Paraburkholderia sprentiae]APA85018.1 hypothetical protein BJG93_06230 [Paraburkholderia sprentiae WSM5005]